MATVPCPYCYNRINQARLAYQCLGRGAPGASASCSRTVDKARADLTDVSIPAYPVFTVEPGPMGTPRQAPCPTCHGVTGVRACPVCHTPLSATFADSRSPLVGMVGGKGAGKSIYLAVLNRVLRTAVRRRFQADIRLTGDQQGGAGSPRQWLEGNEEQLFTDRKLFAPTAQSRGGMRAPVVIEWRQPRRRMGRETYDTTILSFYDAAGEDLTNQDRVHTQAYLGVAGGLIVLLDPWQLPGARERIDVPADVVRDSAPPLEVLGRITDMLRTTHQVRARNKVKVPLAVVFAKMDAFFDLLGTQHPLLTAPPTTTGYDETTGADTHEHVKALLHRYGADDVHAHLHANYATYRYFAVSALGAPPDYRADTVHSGGVQPFRVEEPLLWLMNRFGVIERSRG